MEGVGGDDDDDDDEYAGQDECADLGPTARVKAPLLFSEPPRHRSCCTSNYTKSWKK